MVGRLKRHKLVGYLRILSSCIIFLTLLLPYLKFNVHPDGVPLTCNSTLFSPRLKNIPFQFLKSCNGHLRYSPPLKGRDDLKPRRRSQRLRPFLGRKSSYRVSRRRLRVISLSLRELIFDHFRFRISNVWSWPFANEYPERRPSFILKSGRLKRKMH